MLSPEDTPRWFDPNLFDDAEWREVSVAGASIRYFAAGKPSAPTLLFVHGARAHARWWQAALSFLAPRGIRWLAVDLSGHGESGWRKRAATRPAVARLLVQPEVLRRVVGHERGELGIDGTEDLAKPALGRGADTVVDADEDLMGSLSRPIGGQQ